MIIFFLHSFDFGVLLILQIRVVAFVGEFDSEFFWFSDFCFFFFSWVFGILMGFLFAHHKKFRGFSEMEVGWVFLQKLIFVDFFGCNR